MTDYKDFCPGGDAESFSLSSQALVERYKSANAPMTKKDIDRQINQLQNMIRKLKPDTRTLINARELAEWQVKQPAHQLVGEGFSDGIFTDRYMNQAKKIRDGGSTLDLLERLSAEDYGDSSSIKGKRRKELISDAALCFSIYSGELKATLNSPFVKYLQQIFFDVSLENADCLKAARTFIKENPGVLD